MTVPWKGGLHGPSLCFLQGGPLRAGHSSQPAGWHGDPTPPFIHPLMGLLSKPTDLGDGLHHGPGAGQGTGCCQGRQRPRRCPQRLSQCPGCLEGGSALLHPGHLLAECSKAWSGPLRLQTPAFPEAGSREKRDWSLASRQSCFTCLKTGEEPSICT